MIKTVIASALMAVAMVVPAMVFAEHSEEMTIADVPMTHQCAITTNIGFGSRGADVACLQDHLIASGFLPASIQKGYFGAQTKAAVAAWQRSKTVYASGYFGPISRTVLTGIAVPMPAHTESSTHVDASSTNSTDAHQAAHVAIDVEQWSLAPSVSIAIHKDAMSGYNLEIRTENFRFAPEHASSAVIPNEGHAHLMINGKKLARVYSNWFHIPVEALTPGTAHEVLVTLNANDHSELAVRDMRVQATSTIML